MSSDGYERTGEPGRDELLFLPLGGTNEIGMNLNLFGHAGQWIAVDMGITFGDDRTPGIDVIMPDPAFIEERLESFAGLVLTHAHEDHIGAVPYLWPRLQCPLYATPFTAAVLRRKLDQEGLEDVPITEIPLSGTVRVGPFDIQLISLTHSIPEPNALVLRTPVGTILHTGDWKLDPDPLVGTLADEEALRAVGSEGVLAMVCDSTNALVPGHSGSELDVRENLVELIGRCENRVVVASFASNIARMESIAHAAEVNGRHTALVGRSLWRMHDSARETGYLNGAPRFLSEEEAALMPRGNIVMLCTGSQGENRSALARIARGDHPHVALDDGDTAIFSSRMIPGNEKAIGFLQNALVRQGVEIITADDEPVHVSGHPNRDELTQMYQWVRPQIAVPVHGEPRHLAAHAKLAATCQVPQVQVPWDGSLIRLTDDGPQVVDEVYAGKLARDGNRLIPLEGGVVRGRRKLSYTGSAVATVVVDGSGDLVADPQISVPGLLDEDDADLMDELVDAICAAVGKLAAAGRRSDEVLQETARVALRRRLHELCGKRPPTTIHLVRV